MNNSLRVVLVLIMAFILSGCGDRVELHRQLSEQEANEVVAELADKHIRAQKTPAKDGVVVTVNTNDIGRAVRTLEAAGLPRLARTTMGDTFRKEGVISTPWKSVPATSMPYPKSLKPPCPRSMALLSHACMWCCPSALRQESRSNLHLPPCLSSMIHA